MKLISDLTLRNGKDAWSGQNMGQLTTASNPLHVREQSVHATVGTAKSVVSPPKATDVSQITFVCILILNLHDP